MTVAAVEAIAPGCENMKSLENRLQNMSITSNGDLQKESNQDSKADMVAESYNPECNGTTDPAAFNAYAGSDYNYLAAYNQSMPVWDDQLGYDSRNYYVAGDNGSSYMYYTSGYGYPHQPSYCPLPSGTYMPGGQGYGQQAYQYSGPIYQHPDLHYYSSPSFTSGQETLPMGLNKGADGGAGRGPPNGGGGTSFGNGINAPNIGYQGLLMPPPPPPHAPSASATNLAPHDKGNGGNPAFPQRDLPGPRPVPPYQAPAKRYQSVPQGTQSLSTGPTNAPPPEHNAKRFPQYPRPFFQNGGNKRVSSNAAGSGKGMAAKPGLGNGEVKLLEKGGNVREVRSGATAGDSMGGISSIRRPYLAATSSDEAGQNGRQTDEKPLEEPAVDRGQFNKDDFQVAYDDAKFYIIKSYSEDDVHKSIKYGVWSSTPNGNKKLDRAYQEAQGGGRSLRPIFLFFSVNSSGQFCGVAEMVGVVDFNKNMDFWLEGKWTGCFPVKWHVIKDVPNFQLRHIILANNDNKPVTHSRDTQEISLKQGNEMLKIFKEFPMKTSLLDDFAFYDGRQKIFQERKLKQRVFQQAVKMEYRPEIKPAKLNPTEPVSGEMKGIEKQLETVDLNKTESPSTSPTVNTTTSTSTSTSVDLKSADSSGAALGNCAASDETKEKPMDKKSPVLAEGDKGNTNYKKALLDSIKRNGNSDVATTAEKPVSA